MHDILKIPRTVWLYLFLLTIKRAYSEPQVYILSENLEQVITSSTLQWVSYNGPVNTLIKNGVVAGYQLRNAENATDGGDETDKEILKVPIYICRAKVAAVWVPGQLHQSQNLCIVSMYRKVLEIRNFEILINIEKRSRLSWLLKNKFTITPQGSVEGGDKIYIARRPVKYHQKDGALTHTIGNFNPNENLGMFSLVDQNNKELKFEDGEILVEQEPIRYEFTNTEFNKIKSKNVHYPKILGTVVLKNEGEGVQRVDTVVSYNYTHYMHWGREHGLLIALPFRWNMKNGTKFTGKWGIPESVEKVEVVPIERYLEEGTAVNVTVKGNYTESDIPYVTTVTAVFKDNFTLESNLRDSLRMKHMTGVVAEFGPIYFVNNRSLVPTTTTTVRTTSITTQKILNTETIPLPPNTEDVYVLDNKSKKPLSNEVVPNETDPDSANSVNMIQQLTKKTDGSSAGSTYACKLVIILSCILMQIT